MSENKRVLIAYNPTTNCEKCGKETTMLCKGCIHAKKPTKHYYCSDECLRS